MYDKDAVNPSSPTLRHLRYENLRKRLVITVEDWPYIYEHKIIGKNNEAFLESLKNFETQFPRINKKSSNVSRNGTYYSITYELLARDVDEIITLWVASEELEGTVTVF